MRVTILGTGAVALAYASHLAANRHEVSLWSPSGNGIRDLLVNGGLLHAEGAVAGEFKVVARPDLANAMASADVVIFALPANAHESVMRVAAPHVRAGQLLVVTPVLSLSALLLAELVAKRGIAPWICVSPTTMLTARRVDGATVKVMTIRGQVEISILPASRSREGLEVMASLFGEMFSLQASLLASSLANINPVAHVPLALMNMTRMEHAETWLQYEHFTTTVSRVINSLDEERLALASAFGFSLGRIEDHFCRSFHTHPDSLAGIARQIVTLRNGGPAGPTVADNRFLSEDVPFGLVFYSRVGKMLGIPTPDTDACIALACTAMNRDYPSQNTLWDALALGARTPEALAEAALNGPSR